MKFASIRDLRVRPGRVWKALKAEEDLVLTSNGKPFAVITNVDEDTLEDTLQALRRRRAQAAVATMRDRAARKGLAKMSDREIESEIDGYRASRRRRSSHGKRQR
jgi:antitoxin (DNA-binding transcriptional repressor) of toxin-antitoxin stability system